MTSTSLAMLPQARSCVVRSDEKDHAALILGVETFWMDDYGMESYGLVVYAETGRIGRVPTDDIVIKFPPHGDDRLLLGWAAKGGR